MAPEYDPTVNFYVRAWSDLETCRSIGFVAGPIPHDAALNWAAFHGLDHLATELLWRVMRYLDAHRSERIENERMIEEIRSKGKR